MPNGVLWFLSALITLIVVKGSVGIGDWLTRRWTSGLDSALRFGLGGLVGLGALGTVTLFVGLVPGGFTWGVYAVGVWTLVGLWFLFRDRARYAFALPKGPHLLALILLTVLGLFALVSVLAPSDADDWDTLAYHLAVPKLWIGAGHIYSVDFISHSNFPDVIDDLYVWGLGWGGPAGAKSFSLGFFLLGLVALFGFARQRYGSAAGWWSAVVFATVPAILWESGTAYIDVGHGLFAGLGILFAALAIAEPERRRDGLILSGILLGLAAASKYTGLQTLLIVGFALLLYAFKSERRGSELKSVLAAGVLALVIAAPWYIKNVVNVGNPVYPFLYERFGGAHWDQRRADIYRNEQQSFGVARTETGRDLTQVGHSVLGLSYQPGRYVNPAQSIGGGSPMGAVGVAILASLVLWAASGRLRRFEGFVLAVSGLTFVPWFFLSQQSRYITSIAPAAAVLFGGAVVVLSLGRIAAVIGVLQAAYTVWLFQTQKFSVQFPVVAGRVDAAEYQRAGVPFFEASQEINKHVGRGRVALYDEVFGYLLDVPYFWANPGHTTTIPYDRMTSADDYVREMKGLGFTHAYINLSSLVKPAEFAQPWIASMGLNGPPVPMPEDVRKAHFENWQTKWEILLADAVAARKLTPVASFRRGLLFRFE